MVKDNQEKNMRGCYALLEPIIEFILYPFPKFRVAVKRYVYGETQVPDDVIRWIRSYFDEARQEEAISVLRGAVDESGKCIGVRIVRSAVFAASGDLNSLKRMVYEIKMDWRDVIVAGEYEQGPEWFPTRVRDFDYPMDQQPPGKPKG
jgi:hypothetical protein